MVQYRSSASLYNIKNTSKELLILVFLILIVSISIGPFLVMIINATRTDAQIASSVTLIPGTNAVDNYRVMLKYIDFPRHILNSAVIAISGTLLSCYFGTMGGYAIAKLDFKGRKVVFTIVIITLMIPWQLGIIGYYSMIAKMGLIDTYWPLILPAIGNPHLVFFLKQYIESSIHTDLLEAARIEGAGEVRIYHKLIIPMTSPAIVTMGILTFVRLWNDYLMALMLLVSKEKLPVQVALGLLSSSTEKRMGAVYIGLTLSVLIIVIVYITQARKILENVSAGAVKG